MYSALPLIRTCVSPDSAVLRTLRVNIGNTGTTSGLGDSRAYPLYFAVSDRKMTELYFFFLWFAWNVWLDFLFVVF